MNYGLSLSYSGLRFIKSWEACKLQAYDDFNDRIVKPGEHVYGTLTIGWGHTSDAGPPRVYAGMVITQFLADRMITTDLQGVQLEVEHLVKVSLNQNQYDALVSFQWNCGWLGHPQCSLLNALNSGNYNLADTDFMLYDREKGVIVKGLDNRRTAEKKLFMTPVASG